MKSKEPQLYLPRLARMQRMFEAQPLKVFCLSDFSTAIGSGQINKPYLKHLVQAKIIEQVKLVYKFGYKKKVKREIVGWRLRK